MVMFAVHWNECGLAALDGNNRITSAVLSTLQMCPQVTEKEVKNPRNFPHPPRMGALASMAEAELILPKAEDDTFGKSLFAECSKCSCTLQSSKHNAKENSVLESVASYFTNQLKEEPKEQLRRWLLSELGVCKPRVKKTRRASDAKCNQVVNKEWWASNMEDHVQAMKEDPTGLPPKLKEEVHLLELVNNRLQCQGKPLQDIFPFLPHNVCMEHKHLPTLQTIVTVCFQTAFWNVGSNRPDEVLRSARNLVKWNCQEVEGDQENEHVAELKDNKAVFRPKARRNKRNKKVECASCISNHFGNWLPTPRTLRQV